DGPARRRAAAAGTAGARPWPGAQPADQRRRPAGPLARAAARARGLRRAGELALARPDAEPAGRRPRPQPARQLLRPAGAAVALAAGPARADAPRRLDAERPLRALLRLRALARRLRRLPRSVDLPGRVPRHDRV